MRGFRQDLRFSLRGLRRNPGFTAVAVLVLGLGIGANVVIFSIAYALVLRPLPFPAPQELVTIPDGIMYPDFVDLRGQARSLRAMSLYRTLPWLLTAPGEPEVVTAVQASAELFSTLGVAPALGRAFPADQDQPGRPRVAVVSYEFWQRRLGADPGVLGRTMTVGGQPVTVLGVAPPGFRFPLDGDPPDMWVSLSLREKETRQWRGYLAYRTIGRLAGGVGLAAAQAEVRGIAANLVQLYPHDNAGRTISLAAYDATVKSARPAFGVLLTAVGLVLLIACANVANLQIVRASARRKEMAVRAALGAGRGRVVRQFLTEGLVLAVAAGVVGVVIAYWSVELVVALLPEDVPQVHAVAFDRGVLSYAAAAAVAAALVIGLVPAVQFSRGNLLAGLGSSDRGSTSTGGRLRAILLVLEIALAAVLLAGAGLLVRSYASVAAVDPGFDQRALLVARLNLPNQIGNAPFFAELHRRLQTLPGARNATIAREMPYAPIFNSWNYKLDDRPPPPPTQPWWANARGVSHTYFDTLGIPIVQGRGIELADLTGSPRVAVVNEAFAGRHWPAASPLGRHVFAYERDVTIVGVAANTRGTCAHAGCAGAGRGRLDRVPEPEIYLPLANSNPCYLAVRAADGVSPTALVAPLRAMLRSLSPEAALTDVRSMTEAIDESLDQRRMVVFLLAAFATLAMILAALGIYGVISYSVGQRTRELGVRMALGARAGQVRAMVVGQGLRLALVGLAVGMMAALALTRVLASQLFGVTSTDPLTYVVLAAVILAVSVLASLVPALRATRVDPMVALRCE